MKGKLYTLLKVMHPEGVSLMERLYWWMVEDVKHEEYTRNLIELRDAGYIQEDNNGDSLVYRPRKLTEKGKAYLPRLKRLYLRELWVKNRWKILAWLIPVLLTIVFGLIDVLNN